ncbi:MAG: cyclic nucleotide-binding domain-containing protein [Anaerolineae bacterium]|nr:cyclic nucleotide-binding domain-containing protein [Anaerolineae bacterium]
MRDLTARSPPAKLLVHPSGAVADLSAAWCVPQGVMMDLIDHLRRVELFSALRPDYLKLLADICEQHEVAPQTRLTRQADLGTTLFIIGDGEAIVHRVDENGIQRPVDVLKAGDSYGMTSLFVGEPRDATVTALTDMTLWSITRRALEELLHDHPGMRRELLVPQEILDKLRAPRYPWLESGELVTFSSRRHWIALVRRLLPGALLLLIYVGVLEVLRLAVLPSLNVRLWMLPGLAIYAVAFAWHWLDWHNDYYAVTNRRISHRERVAFIYESRKEAPLERVQNISLRRDLVGRMLNFGYVTVETAAEVGSMLFDLVPNPEAMRDAIWGELARAQATRRAVQRERMREAIATYARLDTGESMPEEDVLEAQPIDFFGSNGPAGMQPGPLDRFLRWLARYELIPQVRMATPDMVTWRKHWVFLIMEAAVPAILSVALGVLTALAFFSFPPALVRAVPLYPFVMLVLTVIVMGWLWWEVNDWGNDLYIVTNERIIDIEKRPLFFSEERREASLGMIQNVNLEVPNIIASFFNYGDVVIQTAGAGSFTFDRVPNPNDVQNEIFQRMQAFREAQQEREAARRRSEMGEWFSIYDELRHADRAAQEAEALKPGADEAETATPPPAPAAPDAGPKREQPPEP